jgi:hypothetical protein
VTGKAAVIRHRGFVVCGRYRDANRGDILAGCTTRRYREGMGHANRRTRRWLLIAGIAMPFATPSVGACQGILHALVVDTTGVAIPGATITVVQSGRTTHADSAGRATIDRLPAGRMDVLVRQFGYHPQQGMVLITAAPYDSLRIQLVAQAQSLNEIDIAAEKLHPFFQGFEERRARGIGTFITREQIEARSAVITSDLFRTIPGANIVRVGHGMGIRFASIMSIQRKGNVRPDALDRWTARSRVGSRRHQCDGRSCDRDIRRSVNGTGTVCVRGKRPVWRDRDLDAT